MLQNIYIPREAEKSVNAFLSSDFIVFFILPLFSKHINGKYNRRVIKTKLLSIFNHHRFQKDRGIYKYSSVAS